MPGGSSHSEIKGQGLENECLEGIAGKRAMAALDYGGEPAARLRGRVIEPCSRTLAKRNALVC